MIFFLALEGNGNDNMTILLYFTSALGRLCDVCDMNAI